MTRRKRLKKLRNKAKLNKRKNIQRACLKYADSPKRNRKVKETDNAEKKQKYHAVKIDGSWRDEVLPK